MRRLLPVCVLGLWCGCPGPVANPPADKCAELRCTGTQLCNPGSGQCEGAIADAGRDAGLDAGTFDGGAPDAGVLDAGQDAGPPDALADAGRDAGADAGAIDAGCGDDLDCFGVSARCEPTTRACVECFLDGHCPSSVAPVCDVRTNGCVGCVSTADCLNPLPICDAQQCVPCNTSAECGQGRECTFISGNCDPLNDTCATARVILPAGIGTSSITAEPGQAIDDIVGSCNAAGPELVYTFTTTSVRALTVSVAFRRFS